MPMNPRLLRPLSTGFSPRSLSGLAVWFDAADTSVMFDATTGGSLVTTDGTAVARWQDKSGNASHATQGTANNRPLLRVAAVNGRNAVDFDGSNDAMSYADNAYTTATAFVVIQRQGVEPSYAGVFAFSKGFAIYSRLAFSPGSFEWGLYNVSAGTNNPSGEAVALNTTTILAVRRATTNRFLYRNGSLRATVAADATTAYGSWLGIDGSANQAFNGLLCEAIGYSRELSDAERNRIEAYLAKKWAVTLL